MTEQRMRERISRWLDARDAKVWLRRAAIVTAVGGAASGVHALDAGVTSKTGNDAAQGEEDGGTYEGPPAVPVYSVDVGCGGA